MIILNRKHVGRDKFDKEQPEKLKYDKQLSGKGLLRKVNI